jgi:hypothetical protein
VTGWLVLLLTSALSGNPPQRCVASVFGGADDAHRGGPSRCLRPMRPVGADDVGVAHRTLPCGARLLLLSPRTGRWTTAAVVDHGPYGALDAGSWVVKRRRRDPGRWVGCLDLTRPVARRLGHRGGKEPIVWVPLGPENAARDRRPSRVAQLEPDAGTRQAPDDRPESGAILTIFRWLRARGSTIL